MSLDIEARWTAPADESSEPELDESGRWLETAAVTFAAASGALIAASLSVLMHLA